MNSPSRLACLFSVCCAASSVAQSFVVPADAPLLDANAGSLSPFTYDAFRFQQLWDGAAIAPNQATITGMAWRRDAQDNTAFGPGVVLTNVTAWLGTGATMPATMSRDFAANRAGQTQVFSGALNLPAQPPAQVFANFNVVMPLAQSFVFASAGGSSLLFEIESPGRATTRLPYKLDAAYYGSSGSVTTFGTGGSFPGGRRPSMGVDMSQSGSPPATIVPGGSCALRVRNLPSPLPTAVMFGLSTTLGQAGLLPIDLTPLGAPGNTLSTSADVSSGTLTPTASGATYTVDFPVPIPNNPALVRQVWFNQSLTLDATANGLGVVLSNGLSVVIGGYAQPTPMQQLFSSDSNATRGILGVGGSSLGTIAGGGSGGLVVEFRGTRQ